MHNQKGGSIVLTSASGMNLSVCAANLLLSTIVVLCRFSSYACEYFNRDRFDYTSMQRYCAWSHTLCCMQLCHDVLHTQQRCARQQSSQPLVTSCDCLCDAVAHTGVANHDAIAAAKGAVAGLTKGASATYAPHKIRVNCIAPGLVSCPLYIGTRQL